MKQRILSHFARVGGVLVAPRSTFEKIILGREGTLLELVPWLLFVAVAIAPIEAGRAVLLFRANWWEGVMSFLTMMTNRLSVALVGVLAAAVLLYLGELIFRTGEEKRGFDLALDAAAFLLVPYFLLAVLGTLLSVAGLELWWMPHRMLRGTFEYQLIRGTVSFGWSIILFYFAARVFWRRSVSEGHR